MLENCPCQNKNGRSLFENVQTTIFLIVSVVKTINSSYLGCLNGFMLRKKLYIIGSHHRKREISFLYT